MRHRAETMLVNGTSDWQGPFRTGTGTLSTESDTLTNVPYSFASRFERAPGACPEELLATAHAACYNHALANISGLAGLPIEAIHTRATVAMGRDERGPAVLGIHLDVTAHTHTLDEDRFKEMAEAARVGCALSKALAATEITMDARLIR